MAPWGIPIINAPNFTQGCRCCALGIFIGHSRLDVAQHLGPNSVDVRWFVSGCTAMVNPDLSPLPHTLRSSHLMDVGLWMLRRRQRFRVTGDSMRPLLIPGEEVLIDPTAYRHTPPQPGDLVVAQHPQQPELRLIKEVVSVDVQGCFLQGVNRSASTDSRTFGRVPLACLLGRVVCRFP
jgi:nickel-type superoxide dismutase maturation protease